MNWLEDRNRLTALENKLMVAKIGAGINQEFRIKIYTLLHIKQITIKDLLYSTGKYTQHLMTYSGKESQKEHLYMNHFAVRLKPVQHCKLTILQLKYNEKFFLSRPGYDYKIMSDWLLLFLNKPENLLRIPSSLERALKLLPENYLLDQSANPTRRDPQKILWFV